MYVGVIEAEVSGIPCFIKDFDYIGISKKKKNVFVFFLKIFLSIFYFDIIFM